MTPYEYADLAQSTFGNSMTCYALILSIVSGYLVTTYLVGAKLTRFQATLLTTIFLFVMGFLAVVNVSIRLLGYRLLGARNKRGSPRGCFLNQVIGRLAQWQL